MSVLKLKLSVTELKISLI